MGWIYEFSKATEVFCFRVSVTELTRRFPASHSLIKFRLLKLIVAHSQLYWIPNMGVWFFIFSLIFLRIKLVGSQNNNFIQSNIVIMIIVGKQKLLCET